MILANQLDTRLLTQRHLERNYRLGDQINRAPGLKTDDAHET